MVSATDKLLLTRADLDTAPENKRLAQTAAEAKAERT